MTDQNTFRTYSFTGLALTALAISSLPSGATDSTSSFIPYQRESVSFFSEVGDFSAPVCWKYDTFTQQLYFAPELHQTEAARKFVEGSEDMERVLRNLQEKLRLYFGVNPLMLELVHDPEFGEDGLLLSVMVKGDIESACEMLRRFEDEWWLDQMGDVESLFSVDVMPV